MDRMASPYLPILISGLLILLATAPTPAFAGHVDSKEIVWACGSGPQHPDFCGISAIHDPVYSDNVWIDGEEDILGVEINGVSRAFPVRMLDQHEMVNDVIGGVAVVITWCPLCGSGVTFERTLVIDGEETLLSFEVSGFLYAHDLVMWDRETQTMWTQIRGAPIAVLDSASVTMDHPDLRLQPIPTTLSSWDDWKDSHPDSLLLQKVRSSYGSVYRGYDSNCNWGILGKYQCELESIHPKELVLGITVEDGALAFVLDVVRNAGGIGTASLRGTNLVVSVTDSTVARVYDAGNHRFTEVEDHWEDEDGIVWDLHSGERIDGLESLEIVDSLILYWFAWHEHNPGTEIWDGEDGSIPTSGTGGAQGSDSTNSGEATKRTPAVGILAGLLLLGLTSLGLALLRRRT